MSYFINPIKEDQCVFVTYEGKATLFEIMASRYEANEVVSVKQWNRLVVNIAALQSTPTTLELINLASDLSTDLPRSTRIALVVRPDQVNYYWQKRERTLLHQVAEEKVQVFWIQTQLPTVAENDFLLHIEANFNGLNTGGQKC